MFARMLIINAIILACLLTACSRHTNTSGTDTGNTPPAGDRPSNTLCVAGDRAAPAAGVVALQQVFSALSFASPLAMVQAPQDDSRWYVIEQPGRVYVFDNIDSVANRELLLDITERVDSGPGEAGLLGIAVHPDFRNNGYIYLSYTSSDDPVSDSGANLVSRISRFTMNSAGTALDSASEQVVLSLSQPYGNHNGGNIAFGPDGYLYMGFGDGGSGGDPQNNAQNLDVLLGKMLRIDVDVSQAEIDSGIYYKIPAGNPFAGSSGCDAASDNNCGELFAWGLRNPWRWSFDRLTGALWAGDVGQNNIEEVDLIESGNNYGWRCYEGTSAYNPDQCADASVYTEPKAQYTHDVGYAVTGGFVYRGAAIPDLTGVYLYADYSTGRLWALNDPYGAATVQELLQTGLNIPSFAQGNDGEVYVLAMNGSIYQLVQATASSTASFAALLSETGCADSDDPTQPSSGMIPYQLNTPLWSDGAVKQRWLALPDTAYIHINAQRDWEFPVGSVLRKDFYLGDVIVETRLLAHHSDGGWAGYSYEWNDAQTDAVLLTDGKTKTVGAQTWTYPSSADCLLCHTTAAGRTLGPETAQLNRLVSDPEGGVDLQQLAALNALGVFDASLTDVTSLPALTPIDDDSKTLEQRARSYLHANCSHCHRPGGTGRGGMDLRYSVSFEAMNVCNALPETGDLGISGSHIVTPGDPDSSLIVVRMQDTGGNRMPPLGTAVVDADAVQVIRQWIASMAVCP